MDEVAQGARLLAARYELGPLIGRGGMSDVHLAVDAKLGRRVAVKLLKSALASSFVSLTPAKRSCANPVAARRWCPTSSWSMSKVGC
jgi:serine/threonine protein kinase